MASHKRKIQIGEARKYLELLDRALSSKYEVCGSIRRGKTEIGDIDFIVSGSLKKAAWEIQKECDRCFADFKMLSKTINKKMDFLIDAIQFNAYLGDEANWGAMKLFLTGNHIFGIKLRAKAKRDGMKLNQYGLWFGQDLIAGKTERQIFDALGMSYVAPQERQIHPFTKRRS